MTSVEFLIRFRAAGMLLLAIAWLLPVASSAHAAGPAMGYSNDLIGPYQELGHGRLDRDDTDDWGCHIGDPCRVCALGKTPDLAERTLNQVVAAWKRDYGMKSRLTQPRSEPSGRSDAYAYKACGDLRSTGLDLNLDGLLSPSSRDIGKFTSELTGKAPELRVSTAPLAAPSTSQSFGIR